MFSNRLGTPRSFVVECLGNTRDPISFTLLRGLREM
jgi:hypothetical protein